MNDQIRQIHEMTRRMGASCPCDSRWTRLKRWVLNKWHGELVDGTWTVAGENDILNHALPRNDHPNDP